MSLSDTVYSIKDLENFSGIKAHTIRIWEKRYNVLQPMRTETNIRYYDTVALKKLLNITLLHHHGYKISVISKYPEDKIPSMLREILSDKNVKHHAINSFKMAMLEFDENKFLRTYDELLSTMPFREVFNGIIVPLLNEVGMLWQTASVSAAHEHFISSLFRQKLMINIHGQQRKTTQSDDTIFVLFLPNNEINDFGLLYLHYEILAAGCKALYLGGALNPEGLSEVSRRFRKITFVTYLSIMSTENEINSYIASSVPMLLTAQNEWWITGSGIEQVNERQLDDRVSLIPDFSAFIRKL